MELDVNQICQNLMNNVANALTQYYYLAIFLYYKNNWNPDEHLFNWGNSAHSMAQHYLLTKEKLAKYADLITPIDLGIHLIDKLNYKIDSSKIAEAYKAACEQINYAKLRGDIPGCLKTPCAKEVYNLFADNGKALKELVITIHDLYFELIDARLKAIKNKKE